MDIKPNIRKINAVVGRPKLYWEEPEDDSITKVYIYTSTTKYGTYSELVNINATSDGLTKSSSNTWVTSYTDATGTFNTFYKIKFYDDTNYSEYSESVTLNEHLTLCTVDDVKKAVETVGRWTDEEIYNNIEEVDELIYIEGGDPLQMTHSAIGRIDTTVQSRYYVGEPNVYRIDRIFYGTTTKTEFYKDDEFKTNNKYGMIEILPYASSGITLDIECDIEISYVPGIYHKVSLYRTCKRLLEAVDTTSGGEISKELEVIDKRLAEVEQILINRIGVQLSGDVKFYDSKYGINRRKVIQDFDRNKFLGGTHW